MLTDWAGRLRNALIVGPPWQVTDEGWKDFKSPADASQMYFCSGFCFHCDTFSFFFIVRRYILFRLCTPTRAFLSAERLSLRWHWSASSVTKKERKITLSRGDSKRPAWKVIVIAQQPCPNLVQTLRLDVTQVGAVKPMIVFITTWREKKKDSGDQRVDVNKTFVRDCSTFG